MKSFPLSRKLASTLLVFGLMLAGLSVQAQEVTEGKREFKKKATANALTIVVEGQEKNVQEVMDKKFATATGARGKNSKGLKTFENARMADISSGTMDIFYRVEKTSKAEPPQTRVTLFLSTGNDNFMTSKTHEDEIANAEKLLGDLQLDVTKYEFTLAIENQNKVIEKEIKNHDKMVKDSVSLEQKLAETIEAIENNKVERANQLVKIEEEKQNLIRTQQTLTALEQFGLEGLERNSVENMEKQMDSVARKPELNDDKKINVKDGEMLPAPKEEKSDEEEDKPDGNN